MTGAEIILLLDRRTAPMEQELRHQKAPKSMSAERPLWVERRPPSKQALSTPQQGGLAGNAYRPT